MSNNPFAALAGDDDASDIGDAPAPKQQSKPVEAAKKPANAAPAAKRYIPGQSKPAQKQADVSTAEAAAGFEGERGRDDRGTGFQRGRGGRGRGERGTGARGAGRGGRGGRAERPDRRSQTGREDSAKAEHQGWGGDDGKRELEAEVEGQTDAAAEAKEGDAVKPAEANGDKTEEAAAPAAPAEEEDNSLTYEEYLKQKKAAPIAGVSQVQARKANEGADENQWKDGVVHTKEAPTEFFTIEKERAEKARKEKARKEKQFLEVEFSAPARQERGGDRGRGGARGGRGRGEGRGRGDARGGRGRGAPRGGRGGNAAAGGAKINVDDDKAFPSLA